LIELAFSLELPPCRESVATGLHSQSIPASTWYFEPITASQDVNDKTRKPELVFGPGRRVLATTVQD
jgi:hypothetical protein